MGPNSSCDASGVIVFSSYLVHNMLDLNNKNEFIAEIVVVFLIPFLPLASTNFDKKNCVTIVWHFVTLTLTVAQSHCEIVEY